MLSLRKILRRFGTDETGTLMAESVLVLPFMLWSYLALFVYWDSYRAVNVVQKAAYTISDMISREMLAVNDTYINGMDSMMEYLIDSDQDAKTRVSSITWSQLNNRYEVQWSRSPGNAMPQRPAAHHVRWRLHCAGRGGGGVSPVVQCRHRRSDNEAIHRNPPAFPEQDLHDRRGLYLIPLRLLVRFCTNALRQLCVAVGRLLA